MSANNALRFAELVQQRPCLETQQYWDCFYPATNTDPTRGVVWTCEPGNFCLAPGMKSQCSPGFYCPVNTAQPIYCPPKYYCSSNTTEITRCPTGHFCPRATVQRPLPCLFAYCPSAIDGLEKVVSVYVLAIAAAIISLGVCLIMSSNFLRQIQRKRRARIQISVDNSLPVELPVKSVTDKSATNSNSFTIRFENLQLRLNNVDIIRGITGELRSGRLCAIMGPSGSGKTTLISLLTGKQSRTAGQITVNGASKTLSNYRKLVGYVPQEDIMLRELTVYEILMHSAQMRLPRSWSRYRIHRKVDETIELLGLQSVRDKVIGDEERRGISGGQRRRVNIGMELVAEPSILFLDEPISGLDSATAQDVCEMLSRISREKNLLCAAIIHSPNPGAFKVFDDLLLLGRGGQIVYMGSRCDARAYFDSIGFQCPPDQSESDYYMDVVMGKYEQSPSNHAINVDLADLWERHCERRTRQSEDSDSIQITIIDSDTDDNSNGTRRKATAINSFVHKIYSKSAEAVWLVQDLSKEAWETVTAVRYTFTADPVRDTISWPEKYWLLLRRALRQTYSSIWTFITDQSLHLACGLFISTAIQYFNYLPANPVQVCRYSPVQLQPQCRQASDQIREASMFICMGSLFAGISASASTFGKERVVYWRDTASGMPTSAYFLAKLTADLPRIVVNSLMFSLALLLMFPFRTALGELYAIVALLYLNAYGMGYGLSTFLPRSTVALAGTGVALLWALVLSGIFPSLNEVYNLPSSVQLIWDFSAPRWAIEGLWVREVDGRQYGLQRAEHGYKWDNRNRSLLMMFAGAVIWMLLAFIGLKLFRRRKQK